LPLDQTSSTNNNNPHYTVTIVEHDDPNAKQRWQAALELLIQAGRVGDAEKEAAA
jgi:hypothetical protein